MSRLETEDSERGIVADRARRDAEGMIRALYDITSEYEDGFEHQLERLLALGCHRFDMEVGIVSCIIGDRYEVVQVQAPRKMNLTAGAVFELGETYCGVVLEGEEPVALEDVSEELGSHPVYTAMRLEAYVGMPILVGRRRYGTLNFSSARRRLRRFSDADLDCLRLMTSWIGTEIHRRETEEALKRATAELKRLTVIDPLTQLLNRRGLDEKLARVAERAERDGAKAVAVLIDLDDFKSVNDGSGYEAGDKTLVATARAIQAAVRPTDLVGRIGGDEFLAVLVDADVAVGRNIAERVRARIEADADCQTSASFGVAPVALATPDVRSVVRAANAALHASKKAGKNVVSG